MKTDNRRMPAELAAKLDAIAARPDREIDLTDMPEVTDWTGARRGPVHGPAPVMAEVRLEPDVAQWFRDHAGRVESVAAEVNTAVREYIARREAA